MYFTLSKNEQKNVLMKQMSDDQINNELGLLSSIHKHL